MKNWQANFYESILDTKLQKYIADFSKLIEQFETNTHSKETTKWQKQLAKLPKVEEIELTINEIVSLQPKHSIEHLDENEHRKTKAVLKNFMPWRKGPYNFFSVEIDTEWRSNIKWERVLPHLPSLKNKRVLDVGCGSGYHLFRMHQSGAKQVIGIDPTTLFFYQFMCFKQYLSKHNLHFLPIGIEHMPETHGFDCVFSMGVLYHRPDPIKFLKELKAQLVPNGHLILETLVVDGDSTTVLVPTDRYAKMRNVWFIPSVDALTLWLQRVGFKSIECVDIDVTDINEQRATEWMQTQSLIDFLDPNDSSKTIEGYPAPKRAIFIANI